MTNMPKLRNARVALLALAMAFGTVAEAAELMSTHSSWKAYRHGEGGDRMCFAVSAASEQNPPDGERQKSFIYVTAWPQAGIKAEISVLVGFVLKRGAEIKVEVGGTTFTLFADGDRAYVGDVNEELKMLEAMRRGKTLTVTAPAGAGETTKDSYSLSGVTAAIQAVASGCP